MRKIKEKPLLLLGLLAWGWAMWAFWLWSYNHGFGFALFLAMLAPSWGIGVATGKRARYKPPDREAYFWWGLWALAWAVFLGFSLRVYSFLPVSWEWRLPLLPLGILLSFGPGYWGMKWGWRR